MPSVNRPYSSVVPGAVDALVALLTVKFEVVAPAVIIRDGPWTAEESVGDQVAVGWSGFAPGYQFPSRSMSEQLGVSDVSSEGLTEGLAPAIREHFTVACAAISRRGEDDVPAARRAAYANVNLVGQAIAPPNHTWNGTVLQSTMSMSATLHQVKDRRGALAVVTFNIEAAGYAQQ